MDNEQLEISNDDSYEQELIDKDLEGIRDAIESRNNYDESRAATAGLRWQIHSGLEQNAIYTIENLISIIDQAPESIEEDTDQEAYTRSLAIEILNDTFKSKIYMKYPDIEEKVLDSALRRRLKLDKDNKYSDFDNSDSNYFSDEYYALRDFLNNVEIIKNNNPVFQEKIFETFVNGTSLKDSSIILSEIDTVNYILNETISSHPDIELINRYMDILVDREESLDLNDEYDLHAKSFMPYIYKTIFSNLKYNVEAKKQITDKLLPIIFDTIKTCPKESLRAEYIWLLDTLHKQPVGVFDKKYISQQTDIDAQIVSSLIEVVKEPLKEDIYPGNNPQFIAQRILIDILERHSKGVIHKQKRFLMANKSLEMSMNYVKAFRVLESNLPNNPSLKRELLRKYDKFLNLDLLSERTHPFYHLGRKFLREYYKEE